MSEYKGTWSDKDWYQVTKDGKPFSPLESLKLRNHSPDGFSWGYEGSGPAQLALAILLEEFGKEIALRYYQDFKRDVIARFKRNEFTLDSGEILQWAIEKGANIEEGR